MLSLLAGSVADGASVVADVGSEGPVATVADGRTCGRVCSSEWSPTGCKGRRSVPLFGSGLIPSESQRMLYTSMFSKE